MKNSKPILAVLVGISGSGKSTYANSLKTALKLENGYPVRVIETDAIRGELTNDPSDQSKNAEVFSLARSRVSSGLKQGDNVVIDATSTTARDRRSWVDIGKANDSIVRAYFINTDVGVAKKRNIGRSRVVPEAVIDRQKSKLTTPSQSEGFDSVVVI